MSLRHKKVSAKADSADSTIVQPSDWNDNHTVASAGILYGPEVGEDLTCAAAGQQYFRYLRRKFNSSSQEEYEFADPIELCSSDYNFTAQSPAVSLTASVGSSVTLSPVPLGINAANIDHYLLIEDAISGNEIVEITGGTATSGASSGTIQFTPTLSHTAGQYTIKSATSGIQEALWVLIGAGNGGIVRIPTGEWPIYATITYRGAIGHILGCNGTTLNVQSTLTDSVFIFDASGGVASHNKIANFRIVGYKTSATASTVGMYCIRVKHQYNLHIQGIVGNWCYHGVKVETDDCFRVLIKDFTLDYIGADGNGVEITGGTDTFIETCWFKGTPNPSVADTPLVGESSAIRIYNSGAVWVHNTDGFLLKYGYHVSPGDGQEAIWLWVSDSAFDNCLAFGFYIIPAGTGNVRGLFIDNSWAASCRMHGMVIGGGAGVASLKGVNVTGCRFINNYQRGVSIHGDNTSYVNVINNLIADNNAESAGAGDYSGVETFDDPSYLNISANQIIAYNQEFATGAGSSARPHGAGIVFHIGVVDNLICKDNVIRGYKTAPILNFTSSAKQDIDGNSDIEGLIVALTVTAGAVTLSKDGSTYYTIASSSAIDTINGGVYGQLLTLNFTNAAPGGLTSGGNIQIPGGGTYAMTVNQNVMLQYVRDDTWRIVK